MTQFVQQALNGLLLGGMYSLMALGLTLMFGVMKIVNFAYGTLYMAGGYIAYVFVSSVGLSFFPALAVTFLTMTLFGIVLEFLAFRPLRASEDRTIILGLGLLLLGRGLVIGIFGSQIHNLGVPLQGRISVGSVVFSQQRLLTFGVAIALVFVVWFLLTKTRAGSIVRAVSDDAERAALLGINYSKVFSLVFGLSTGLAALAAGLLSVSFGVAPTMDDLALITSFSIAILGGLGSIPGALAGGLMIGVMGTLGTQYLSQTYSPMYPYLLLLLVLLIRPEGIFGRRTRST